MSTKVDLSHLYKTHKTVPKDVIDFVVEFCDRERNRDYVPLMLKFYSEVETRIDLQERGKSET